MEGTHARLAGGERRAERPNLLRRLDGARVLEDRLSVDDARSERVEGPDHEGVGPVDGEGVGGAPVLAEGLADLRRPAGRHPLRVVRDQHVVEGDRRADVVHGLEPGAQMPPGREVEEHRRAVRERERVADDVVHRPHLHVARAGRVAKVDGVHHEHRLVLPAAELVPDALRAMRTHRPLVDGLDGWRLVHRLVLRPPCGLERSRTLCLITEIPLRFMPAPPISCINYTKHPPVSYEEHRMRRRGGHSAGKIRSGPVRSGPLAQSIAGSDSIQNRNPFLFCTKST